MKHASTTDRTAVLAVSDGAYLRHLRALARSLRVHAPSARVIFHLINVSEADGRSLLVAHPDAELRYESRSFRSDGQRRAYCANCRAELLRALLEEQHGTLLYLDADSIVRRNLGELFETVRKYDITIHQRDTIADERALVATGVIGVTGTEESKRFMSRWADMIRCADDEWFNDQLFFARCRRELAGAIRLGQLPSTYIDWEFHRDSAIWVGKGERKLDERYRLEEQFYRSRGTSWDWIVHRVRSSLVHAGHAFLTRRVVSKMSQE